MEALLPGSARIEVKHAPERGHSLHAQDVAMPADKNVRRIPAKLRPDSRRPPPRMPADVRHPEGEASHLEPLVLRHAAADELPIDVAPHGPRGGQPFQRVQNLGRPKVSSMENQVDAAEKRRELRMEEIVRVGENAQAQDDLGVGAGIFDYELLALWKRSKTCPGEGGDPKPVLVKARIQSLSP